MKFSYRWLKELSGTEKSPEELAAFLTIRAFEVEGVAPVGFSTEHVFVAEVTSVDRHPDADRLRVARVFLGEKGDRSIVCGAPNLEPKQRVAVALPGAFLPCGMEIRETDIRGVHSEGMICSEKELGLGENHEGILVLPDTAEIGRALRDAFGSSDFVLDVKILPDRAHDCLSHVGLAREIAALEGRIFDYDYAGLVLPKSVDGAPFSVSLDAGEKSLRYIGALVEIQSGEASPTWLADRLAVLGMRSISGAVDATNLIMLELGQPLHAFDWDRIAGGDQKKIGPRFARSGETVTLLNGKTYTLDDEDIVIADGTRILALAGIMGALDSGITPETKRVLFESAHFDPALIRRTRTRLGIESDASFRFEKGISPDLPERALARLLEVVSHTAGGKTVAIVDCCAPFSFPPALSVSPESIRKLLGTDVSDREMRDILECRAFRVENDQDRLTVTPPSFRLDINSEADIAEDIGKGIGYDRVRAEAPNFDPTITFEDPVRALESSIRTHMAANGFIETLGYSFYSERDMERCRLDRSVHFALRNPMNPDQAYVRTTLLPGLLRTLSTNMRRFPHIRFFECGRTYESREGASVEIRRFSGAVLLPATDTDAAFRLVQASLLRLFMTHGARILFRPHMDHSSFWHPSRSAECVASECETIGRAGEIHPSILRAFGIVGRVGAFEIDTRAFASSLPQSHSFVPMRKYPETLRDLSIFVPDRTLVSDIERIIFQSGGGLVTGVELFDRYRDPQEGRSLAFHIRFGKESGTVSTDEADEAMLRVVRNIEAETGGRLRAHSEAS